MKKAPFVMEMFSVSLIYIICISVEAFSCVLVVVIVVMTYSNSC